MSQANLNDSRPPTELDRVLSPVGLRLTLLGRVFRLCPLGADIRTRPKPQTKKRETMTARAPLVLRSRAHTAGADLMLAGLIRWVFLLSLSGSVSC
jgi:hypothetical protein